MNTNFMQTGKTIWELTRPHYRDMHGMFFVEAICEHGIGHHRGVHGCDGCCEKCPLDIWEQTTNEEHDLSTVDSTLKIE